MNKKKNNWFKIIFLVFLIVYICLYALNKTGYYNGSLRKKVEMTKEEIEHFEKDVEEGKNIDLEDYIEYNNKNYSNSVSKLGYTVSNSVNKIVKGTISGVVNFLSKFLT